MNDNLVIIFAGGLSWDDYSDSPLWDVDKQAIERMLEHLKSEGIYQVSICVPEAMEIVVPEGIECRRLDDEGLSGTLGCVFREVIHWDCSKVIILNARMLCPPQITDLINDHDRSEASVTLFRDPYALDFDRFINPIYICDRELFERVPEVAYSDLKEGLLAMLKGDARVVHLERNTGRYGSLDQYHAILCQSMEALASQSAVPLVQTCGTGRYWQASDVNVDDSLRTFGDVWVQNGCAINKEVAVVGPSVFEGGVLVKEGAVVCRGVLLEGSCVEAGTVVRDTVVDSKRNERMKHSESCPEADLRSGIHLGYMRKAIGTALLMLLFFWATAQQWGSLWTRLYGSEEYSSGLLVPFLTGYILWSRWEQFKGVAWNSSWWGALILLLGQGMRITGMYYASMGLQDLSLIVSITGLVWLMVGTGLFLKAMTSIAFLGLMLPWPSKVQGMIALPLQEYATKSAVFCLQILGYDVLREGMLISIGDTTVAVAEACNGLRMITAFLVISCLVAMLVRRPFWQKVLLCISSLPIALICNTIRLTVTSIAFTKISGEYWEKVFHDFGGYAMMPLALALVVLELWILEKLTSPPEAQKRVVIKRS